MTRFKQSYVRNLPMGFALVAGIFCWSSECGAQEQAEPIAPQVVPSPHGDALRLTDAERNKILDSNTVESAAAVRGELGGTDATGLGIHGELGVMIGSNGARGVYGAAEIPLGDNASATIMFEASRLGGYRHRAAKAP